MNNFENVEVKEVNKNMFVLDKYNLDEEWENQSTNMYTIGDLATDAMAKYIFEKSKLNKRKAEIELEYRTGKREREGLTKLTEGSISAAVDSDEELFEMQQEVNRLKYQADKYNSGVEALKDKKRALEYETQLFFAKYFSEPTNKLNSKTNNREETDFLKSISEEIE